MLRIACEAGLVVIAFVGEDLSETLVRQNPVVHAVRHRSDRVEKIAIPGLEPDTDRLHRAVGNQGRTEMRVALRNLAALDAETGDRRSRPSAEEFRGATGE